ncbi:hypothetical protein LC612_39110, partial [Nostoc sp. CHAB 5834]|nr:hypothetical protein [Nostoc sp. CHAB 5834]
MSLSTKRIQEGLLSELIRHRNDAGLTQADLAERMGSSRMTVARAEAPGADLKLSSFVAMTAALGFVPRLTPIPSPVSVVPKNQEAEELAPRIPVSKHVHRGYAHNRTKVDLQWRDRQRERA